jgi:hypothetical protein
LRVAAERTLLAVVFARDIVAAMLCGWSAPIAANGIFTQIFILFSGNKGF